MGKQYEAALAAKNDGWIEWCGGERPVDNATEVDIKFRTGGIVSGVEAGDYYWPKTGREYAIIAYRLRQPQESEQPEASEEDLNECIGQAPATAWNGEGLPPVGCECERRWCGDKWLPCKILFVSDEMVVVKLATREAAYGRHEVSFRPLRTEAERAIDEMVRLSGVSTGAAKILYDAGYRK
ncbi:MAG: hypothetical protein [Caudoviricetes sp.]|nr:MAG: hypothetical protein [Caudoviricetes sp.]